MKHNQPLAMPAKETMMPCYDPPRTVEELNRYGDMSKGQIEAVLCGAMRSGLSLDAINWRDVGVERSLVERWWKRHQEDDNRKAPHT